MLRGLSGATNPSHLLSDDEVSSTSSATSEESNDSDDNEEHPEEADCVFSSDSNFNSEGSITKKCLLISSAVNISYREMQNQCFYLQSPSEQTDKNKLGLSCAKLSTA